MDIIAAIKVTSEKQSRLVQEELNRLGYSWRGGVLIPPNGYYLHTWDDGSVTNGIDVMTENVLHLKDLKGREILEQIN